MREKLADVTTVQGDYWLSISSKAYRDAVVSADSLAGSHIVREVTYIHLQNFNGARHDERETFKSPRGERNVTAHC